MKKVLKLFNLNIGVTFSLFILFVLTAYAQQNNKPANGDTINYTQVMFEFNQVNGAVSYQLQVAFDFLDFDQALFYNKKISSLALAVDNIFDFGNSYRWRYLAFDKENKLIFSSQVFRFFIKKEKWCDPLLTKLEIKRNATDLSYQDMTVFDYGIIADKKGIIKYFLPHQPNEVFRNIILNRDGNLTFTNSINAFEVNLKGELLWKSPLIIKDSIELLSYHHDIKKLNNGNFLCLADKKPSSIDNRLFSVIFEIDRNNKVKWIWDEESFYKNRTDTVKYNHVNAVAIEEERGVVFTSSRNINTITKFNFKNGSTRYTIGHCIENVSCYGQNIFNGQHSISIMPNKNLMLFNNNSENLSQGGVSSVIEFKQPSLGDTSISPVWEYIFNFEKLQENQCIKAGDADLLPNGNILITSGANNKVFEVTRNKDLVWECNMYSRDSIKQNWTPQSSYRSHFISSLYPCYYTVEHITYLNNDNGIRKSAIKINNDGSEDDNYEIKLITPSIKTFKVRNVSIKSGKSLIINDFPMNTTMRNKNGKKKNLTVIEIRSVQNPELKRTVKLK